SFVLAISGLFLPKAIEFDAWWMRGLFLVAGILLLDAVILLLVYFGVGRDMMISLDQQDVELDEDNLKKSLINQYLNCQRDTDNRTDYLVNVYEASRFFALSAFFFMLVLVAVHYLSHASPAETERAIRPAETERVIQQLRSDPKLIEILRGPKGEKGERG